MTAHKLAPAPQINVISGPIIESSKIATRHLSRVAMVYVRQSSTRQVKENIESTQLQYSLASRARAYGWPDEQVVVIDDDLGISGQSLEGREGFSIGSEITVGFTGRVSRRPSVFEVRIRQLLFGSFLSGCSPKYRLAMSASFSGVRRQLRVFFSDNYVFQ